MQIEYIIKYRSVAKHGNIDSLNRIIIQSNAGARSRRLDAESGNDVVLAGIRFRFARFI